MFSENRGNCPISKEICSRLLSETSMLRCKPAVSPNDVKANISAYAGEQIDRERYQRLVGKLIYLGHTRPDISFAVNVVSRYMHNPRKGHMDTVYLILRYLKSALGKARFSGRMGT
jgi:hypothetical protein